MVDEEEREEYRDDALQQRDLLWVFEVRAWGSARGVAGGVGARSLQESSWTASK